MDCGFECGCNTPSQSRPPSLKPTQCLFAVGSPCVSGSSLLDCDTSAWRIPLLTVEAGLLGLLGCSHLDIRLGVKAKGFGLGLQDGT